MASALPRICLMRREAWLRSQRPMSQRPVKPRASQLVELLVGDLVEARRWRGRRSARAVPATRRSTWRRAPARPSSRDRSLKASGSSSRPKPAERRASGSALPPETVGRAARPRARPRRGAELAVDDEQVGVVEPAGPVDADPAQLRRQRLWRGEHGLTQPRHERARRRGAVGVGLVRGQVSAGRATSTRRRWAAAARMSSSMSSR